MICSIDPEVKYDYDFKVTCDVDQYKNFPRFPINVYTVELIQLINFCREKTSHLLDYSSRCRKH